MNQAIGQVRDLFLSMTPAARVTALLLVGVIGVSLAYLFQHHGASPDDYLFNGEFLAPRDADRAEAAIAQAGLSDYDREGNRIRVPRGQKAAYLAAVADNGALPPNFHSIIEKALDTSPFMDPETRRQRAKAAREQQLSMLVGEMDGIEEARVIFDIREPKGLSRVQQATATVSVRPEAGDTIDPRRTRMIRQAVAGAIAGLTPDDVTIANTGDGSTYGSEAITDFDDPYFKNRVAFERQMKANIENLLRDIPGVKVEVTAELDVALERRTESIAPEGEVVAQRDTSETEESINTRSGPGGRPGTFAQGPGRSSEDQSQALLENKTTSETKQSDNFVGTKNEVVREAGLVPQHVRAAIAIPSDYVLRVWRERNPQEPDDATPPDEALTRIKDEQVDNIKTIVTPLLPKEIAENPYSNVEVTVFQTLTPEPIEPAGSAELALGWAGQNFNTLMMCGLALASLVMLRSIVKSVPPAEPITSARGPTLAVETTSTSEEIAEPLPGETKEESRERRLKLNKGPSLRDELTDIVREDPDAAAAILKNWINNAA